MPVGILKSGRSEASFGSGAGQGSEERGAVRWTAATALLRLARCHNSALSTEDYHTLSLVMSDPLTEVGHQSTWRVLERCPSFPVVHSSR